MTTLDLVKKDKVMSAIAMKAEEEFRNKELAELARLKAKYEN